jgi:hypothetical protein
MILAFDAKKLESTSFDALVASAQVGTSPVGPIFVDSGRHIVTTYSNRFDYKNISTGLTVIDVAPHSMASRVAGFPRIPTGLFPREFALSPDGKTLLVPNYGSKPVQALNVAQLALN